MIKSPLPGSKGVRLSLDVLIYFTLVLVIALCAMRVDITGHDGEVWQRLAPKKIKNPLRIFSLALILRWVLDGWLDRPIAEYRFWSRLQRSRSWHYSVFALLIGLCSLEPASNHIYDRAVTLEQFGGALALVNLYELAFLLGSGARRAFLITLAVFFGTYLMPLASGYITSGSPAMGTGFCALYAHFTFRWSAHARGKIKWTLLGVFAAFAVWTQIFNLWLAPLAIFISVGTAVRESRNELNPHWNLRFKQYACYLASLGGMFLMLRLIAAWFSLEDRSASQLWQCMATVEFWHGGVKFDHDASHHIMEMLFSLEGGILFHCPLMLFAWAGIMRFCKKDCWMAVGFLLFFVQQLFWQSMLWGWETDGIFRLTVSAPLFIALLHFLSEDMQKRAAWMRRTINALIVACVLWTALAGFQVARNKFISIDDEFELPEWRQRVNYRLKGIERYLL